MIFLAIKSTWCKAELEMSFETINERNFEIDNICKHFENINVHHT